MTLREEQGDLFECGLDAIAHGCNMRGVMGAGVAKEMRRRFPTMYKRYAVLCQSPGFHLGDCWFEYPEMLSDFVVFNLMTQDKPGADASLGAVRHAVWDMIQQAEVLNIKTIGIPRIGCGIGGLEWGRVREAIMQVLDDTGTDVEVTVYTL